MQVELNRKGLESLVKGSCPNHSVFNNLLVQKAGYSYSDQYGRTSWDNLSQLTNDELYALYLVCRDSWPATDTSNLPPAYFVTSTEIDDIKQFPMKDLNKSQISAIVDFVKKNYPEIIEPINSPTAMLHSLDFFIKGFAKKTPQK